MSFLTALRGVINTINVITMLILLYQLVIALFCLKDRPKRQNQVDRNHRFAVIISARNEENVIGHLIASLMRQNYPRECFDVYVVADNCTDATAQTSRDAGAIVYERFDEAHKGKGFALKWIFDIILAQRPDDYDAFCIFDADNLVDPNYLAAMNRQLCCGQDMAQGYRDIKNPGDTWVSGSYAIYFWCLSRFYLRARDNAGLSCLASGTGFMFRSDLIRQEGWNTSTITEDSEFSIQQILKGRKIVFAEDAIFYDEQPTKFKQSMRQRYRWAVGNVQCLILYLPQIFKKGRTNNVGRFALTDLVIYLIAMPGTGLVVINLILTLLMGWIVDSSWVEILLQAVVPILCSLGIMFIHGIITVLMEKKDLRTVVKGLFGWPIFLYTWMYINLSAILYRDTTWKPIAHTKSVSIESMAAENQGEIK